VALAMKPALERLVALSRLDTRLQGIETLLRQIPERESKAQSRLKDAIAALESHRERLKQVELSRREGEREAEALVQQERKFQSQTMQVKSNEELWALQREIQSVKARRSEIETRVLERMEEEEKRKQEGGSFDRGVAEAKTQVSEVQARGVAERAKCSRRSPGSGARVTNGCARAVAARRWCCSCATPAAGARARSRRSACRKRGSATWSWCASTAAA
jgi:predicted  nucleic acid-binding Zn-ribbon protein